MPSKLTQAEKQRRAVFRQGIVFARERLIIELEEYRDALGNEGDIFMVNRCIGYLKRANLRIRALLAPKRKKRGKGAK